MKRFPLRNENEEAIKQFSKNCRKISLKLKQDREMIQKNELNFLYVSIVIVETVFLQFIF